MLFHSLEFLYFFSVVYLLYLVFPHKWQNRMLLGASYVFYGCWDWRFLSLILISTFVDYFCGRKIYETGTRKKRRYFLATSITINLGMLGFFKYYNFFVDQACALLNIFGIDGASLHLNIVLPLGISFYTFQTLSYTIDIYRAKIRPTNNFADFALFVAFFPQLVAGPIERAGRLLPQIVNPRTITSEGVRDGFFLILLGLFKKVIIADNFARIADHVYSGYQIMSGYEIFVGTIAFFFQLYADFSAYSDIARGLAKLMGFELVVNFRTPIFSSNFRDFWNRWHISLYTWLRDYVYIPLGGSKAGTLKTCRNITIIMLLVGFWHGARLNFLLTGIFLSFLLVSYRLFSPYLRRHVQSQNIIFNGIIRGVSILITFSVMSTGSFFLRVESSEQMFFMLNSIFEPFAVSRIAPLDISVILGLLTLMYIEIFQYFRDDQTAFLKEHFLIRYVGYSLAIFTCILTCLLSEVNEYAMDYYYFQF